MAGVNQNTNNTNVARVAGQMNVALWQYILWLETQDALTATQAMHRAFWREELGWTEAQGVNA